MASQWHITLASVWPGACCCRGPVAVLALAALAGCSSTGGLFGRMGSSSAASSAAAGSSSSTAIVSESLEVGDLGSFLTMMRQLIEADPLTQSELFNTARDDAEFAPTRINRLRYALALSVPGHSGFDAEAAAVALRALIAAGETLTPVERTLAALQLNQVEEFMRVQNNLRSLEQELAQADAQALAEREAAVAASVGPLESENERLRSELEAAEAMLEALTNIEESLSGGQEP